MTSHLGGQKHCVLERLTPCGTPVGPLWDPCVDSFSVWLVLSGRFCRPCQGPQHHVVYGQRSPRTLTGGSIPHPLWGGRWAAAS